MNLRFLYPEVFFAIIFLAVPIIIHLFNFRKFKKVYFTNVRFLKNISEKSQSQSRLKHLLVLFSRLLMLLFLILAFTQPYIPLHNTKVDNSKKLVNIFVDNSFSMNSEGRNGILVEDAKRKAHEIVSSFKTSDRFRVLTNDFEARQEQILSREQAQNEIDNIKTSPSARLVSEIMTRLSEGQARDQRNFILSDFQKTITDLDRVKPDTAYQFSLIPLENQGQSNVYIDSCWFESPVNQLYQTATLLARIHNISGKPALNIPVKLYIGNQQKSIASVTIQPGESATVKLSFSMGENGWQSVKVSIADYPVTFDNDYYVSFYVSEKIRIQSIGPSNSYINTLFGKDPYFSYSSGPENQVNYSTLSQNQLILLNEVHSISSGLAGELKKFISKGGSLAVFPPLDADLPSYRDFLGSLNIKSYDQLISQDLKLGKIEMESELYKDVFEKVPENMDMPSVKKHYTLAGSTLSNEERILKLEDGSSLLNRYRRGDASIYVFTAPVEREVTNFGEHALFVPTLYKMAVLSLRNSLNSYTIGTNAAPEYKGESFSGDMVLHITRDKGFDIIPETRTIGEKRFVFENNQVKDAGNYSLVLNGKVQSLLSFNYSRRESDVRQYTLQQLDELRIRMNLSKVYVLDSQNKNLQKILKDINEGIKLWKLCIMLALLFLTAELLLLKFLK